jgi:hypothetical protein
MNFKLLIYKNIYLFNGNIYEINCNGYEEGYIEAELNSLKKRK